MRYTFFKVPKDERHGEKSEIIYGQKKKFKFRGQAHGVPLDSRRKKKRKKKNLPSLSKMYESRPEELKGRRLPDPGLWLLRKGRASELGDGDELPGEVIPLITVQWERKHRSSSAYETKIERGTEKRDLQTARVVLLLTGRPLVDLCSFACVRTGAF